MKPSLALALLVVTSCMGSPVATTPDNGATIVVEPLATFHAVEDPVGEYGISTAGLDDLIKSDQRLGLSVSGANTADSMRVTVIGAINSPGHYHLKSGASVADLIASAGGLPRLSTSKLILRRGDTLFRVYAGREHGVSPVASDIFKLLLLQNGDRVWISEPTPF